MAAQIASGLRDVLPESEIVALPIADGGEGTAGVICSARGGKWISCKAHDALGNPIDARYCVLGDGNVAVMEMSEAAGLWRVPPAQRDPMVAGSSGVGEMLLHAAQHELSEIIIGLGGSATNDGGVGMARTFGFRFLDATRKELGVHVSDLLRLESIESPQESQRLPAIIGAVDVRNHLLGKQGATRIFGGQKGASAEQLDLLESALTRLAEIVARDLGGEHHLRAGAGAAGGLGFGLAAFCGATLRSGFDVVAEAVHLRAQIAKSDVVITGEGRLDAQTLQGKVPEGVARLARQLDKKVYAIAGTQEPDIQLEKMFDAIFLLAQGSIGKQEAVENAAHLLRLRARELAKTFL